MARETPVVISSDALRVGTIDEAIKFALITASASGATSTVAAVSGKKIRVLTYTYNVNAAVNVKWQSASTDKTDLMRYAAQGEGVTASWAPGGHFETNSGEAQPPEN